MKQFENRLYLSITIREKEEMRIQDELVNY